MGNFWLALGLTTFAGMATGIGSAIAFFARRTNYRFLSVATGFSAGVMLYISFVEMFFEGAESLHEVYGENAGNWYNVTAFFAGMLLMGLIDYLVPGGENPHEIRKESETAQLKEVEVKEQSGAVVENGTHEKKLMRTGLFTALAIALHNFPEGLVTFLAALVDPGLGVAIAIAIALHNIPEGISISVPIYYATGSRRKAFFYSMLSGLAEPAGALVAYLVIVLVFGGEHGLIPPQVLGFVFAGVAGIMVYISLDELLPTSRAYGRGHDSILGLMAGMIVMALSLLLMQ